MALEANSLVITDRGWLPAKFLRVGDLVFCQKGQPKEIKTVQLYDEAPCYEVLLDDGVAMYGDHNMVFHIQTQSTRNILNRGFKAAQRTRTVQELLDDTLELVKGATKYKYSTPTCEPVALPEQSLPVPPFVVGLWFGKSTKSRNFCMDREEAQDLIKELRKYGYTAKKLQIHHGKLELEMRPNIHHSFLTKYSEKQLQIPEDYLIGSIDQRLELLRGFFFLRKHAHNLKTGVYALKMNDFSSIRRLQGVVESLGIRTTLSENKRISCYTLYFKTDLQLTPQEGAKVKTSRFKKRFIRKITEVGPKKRVHIDADGPFLVGEGFIPVC